MSTLRHPVGPQPPSVYWRRRLLVLLGIVAVVIIVVLIVWNGGRAAEDARETPAPSGTPSDQASAPPFEAGMCNPDVVRVVAVTDAESYAAGVQPMISMEITNLGSSACELSVGPDVQRYRIVSGSDEIWDSSHCLSGEPAEVTLEPGEPVTTTPFAWDRTRSAPDTCDQERPEVVAGGATYRLSVALGEIESEGDVPFLLN